jgi:hypothetical protein
MNIRMIAGMLLAMLLTVPVAIAEDWVYMGSATLDDGSKMYRYYDKDSVSRNGSYADYVTKEEYTAEQHPGNGESYTRKDIAARFDCANKSVTLTRLRLYNRAGKRVMDDDLTTYDSGFNFPASKFGGFLNMEYQRVCQ